jgi:hypothetical protein
MPGGTDNYVGNAGSGGETYGSDSIGSVQYPRVKVGTGVDGVYNDVSSTNPMPVLQADNYATGNISAANSAPTGTASANSAVAVSTLGKSALSIQVEGSWTGALVIQGRVNTTGLWVQWSSSQSMIKHDGTSVGTIGAAQTGIWQLDCAGYSEIRVSAQTWVSGTATVSLRSTVGGGMIGIDSSIPAGGNQIGTVGLVAGSLLVGDVAAQLRAGATGAATIAKVLATLGVNNTLVKNSAAKLVGWTITNTTGAALSVHFYNKASIPAAGTDVPVFTLTIPAGANNTFDHPVGIGFATGLGYSITGGPSDTDATSASANSIVGALFYA